MRLISSLVFVLTVLLAISASAAHHEEGEAAAAAPDHGCVEPTAPVIPPADTVTAPELKEAAAAVKAYMAAGTDYTDCLDAATDNLTDEQLDEGEAELALIQSHNGMVDKMEATAADFNASLKAYKARRAAEKEAEAAQEAAGSE